MHTAIVVDDDEANLESLSELLELTSTKVLAKCIDGNEAVTSFNIMKPDLVFLDVMMPEYDGMYALKLIRELDSSSKIIMVTADTSEETEQRLVKYGASAIIHKPYNLESITHTVDQLCNGKKDVNQQIREIRQEIVFELKLKTQELLDKWDNENKKR